METEESLSVVTPISTPTAPVDTTEEAAILENKEDTKDVNLLEAEAYGIFSNATDVDSARDALLTAYYDSKWDDDTEAKKIIEHYGQEIKFRLKDQTKYSGDQLENKLPIKPYDFLDEVENPQDAYSLWEKKNTEFLDSTDSPEFLVGKEQLKNNIRDYASEKRNEYNLEQRAEGGPVLEVMGELGNRAIRGFSAAGIGDVVESVVSGEAGDAAAKVIAPQALHSFIDSSFKAVGTEFDLEKYVVEHTDKENNDKFLYQLYEGAFNAGGVIATGVATGGAGIFAGQSIAAYDAITNRYKEALEKTGDPEQASKAAGFEGVSQAIQVLGEQIVFGKIVTRYLTGAGSTAKNVLKEGITEAASESSGQFFSNLGENVQDNRPTLENAGRGVLKAGALGGIIGSGASVAVNTFPGRTKENQETGRDADTQTRKQEIEEFGVPLTPQEVQVIGPQYRDTSSETNANTLDSLPDPEVYVDKSEQLSEGNKPLDNIIFNTEEALLSSASTPSEVLTLEDGTIYNKNKNGLYYPTSKKGKQGNPFDKTFFATPEIAQEIVSKVAQDKTHKLTLSDEGTPVLVTNSDEKVYTELPLESNPSEGLLPIQISYPRKQNNVRKNYPINIGQRIKSVVRDTGIGAASVDVEAQDFKESQISMKLKNLPNLPDTFAKIGEQGLFNPVIKRTERNDYAADIIQRNGFEKTMENFISGVSTGDVANDEAIGVALFNTLYDSLVAANTKAVRTGDTTDLDLLNVVATPFFERYAKRRFQVASGLGHGNLAKNFINLGDVYNKNLAKVYIASAETLGVSIDQYINDEAFFDQRQKDKILASQEVVKVSKLQEELNKLENLLETVGEHTTFGKQLIDKIAFKKLAKDALLAGVDPTIEKTFPSIRARYRSLYYQNTLGGGLGAAIGFVSSPLVIAGDTVKFGLTSLSAIAHNLRAFVNNNLTEEQKIEYHKIPSLDLIADLVPIEKRNGKYQIKGQYKVAGTAAKLALKGRRANEIYDFEALTGDKKPKKSNFALEIGQADYLKGIQNLHASLPPTQNLFSKVFRAAEFIAGKGSVLVRLFGVLDGIGKAIGGSAFEKAVAAEYYNRNIGAYVSPEELKNYLMLGKDRWGMAKASAKLQADALKDAGLEVSKQDQDLQAIEEYYKLIPEDLRLDVTKLAGDLTLNVANDGKTGIITRWIDSLTSQDNYVGDVATFWVSPFTQSVMKILQYGSHFTPIGFFGLRSLGKTDLQRNLQLSSATFGSLTIGAITYKALQQLDLPEEERAFDIIGRYSADPKILGPYTATGGAQYSVMFNLPLVGKTYLPWGESMFNIPMAIIASMVDAKRNGFPPQEDLAGFLSQAFFTSSRNMLNMSMLRNLSQVYDAFSGDPTKGDRNINLLNTGLTPIKNVVIPAKGLLTTIERWFSSPMETRKDIQTALVSGTPILGSMFGLPKLNMFGEPLPANDISNGLYRLFSLQNNDLDARYLVENGYTVKTLPDSRLNEDEKYFAEKAYKKGKLDAPDKLSYRDRHAILSLAGPKIREAVGFYRDTWRDSPKTEDRQEVLQDKVNEILAAATIQYFKQ